MKQHAIQIAKPNNREQMPVWNQFISKMNEWCKIYVATHWEYRDGIFFFEFEKDKNDFMNKFNIKVIDPHSWVVDN